MGYQERKWLYIFFAVPVKKFSTMLKFITQSLLWIPVIFMEQFLFPSQYCFSCFHKLQVLIVTLDCIGII